MCRHLILCEKPEQLKRKGKISLKILLMGLEIHVTVHFCMAFLIHVRKREIGITWL